jgi:hypothetical protein
MAPETPVNSTTKLLLPWRILPLEAVVSSIQHVPRAAPPSDDREAEREHSAAAESPGPQDPRAPPRPQDLDARLAPQPVYYTAPPRQGSGLTLVAGLLIAIFLLTLSVAAAFLLLIASVTGWGGRTVGDASQQVGAALGSGAEALRQRGQEALDRLDPSHPPRTALAYDIEVEEFLKLGVGQALAGSAIRAFSIAAIRSRDGAERPELSRYVVIHSELRQPNETRVLGLTVRKDTEPREDFAYQGEAFRLGAQVYKVNWISPERQQVALIQVRDPDRANLPLKFVYD